MGHADMLVQRDMEVKPILNSVIHLEVVNGPYKWTFTTQ